MGKPSLLVRKVRILCSSGLPLYALVNGLSQEIGQYIPFSSSALFMDSSRPTCRIFPSRDMTHWAAPLHYFRSLPATETGIVPFWELVRYQKTLSLPTPIFSPGSRIPQPIMNFTGTSAYTTRPQSF